MLGAAVVLMGLLAGVFYAFACAVMPGLGDADNRTFVDAMQHINKVIENPVFFATFLGAPVLALWALLRERRSASTAVVPWVVAALVLYVVVLIVTSAVNVPLNTDLEHANPAGLAGAREHFEGPWVASNIVRALAATAAFGCLTWGLHLHGRFRTRTQERE